MGGLIVGQGEEEEPWLLFVLLSEYSTVQAHELFAECTKSLLQAKSTLDENFAHNTMPYTQEPQWAVPPIYA